MIGDSVYVIVLFIWLAAVGAMFLTVPLIFCLKVYLCHISRYLKNLRQHLGV